jgi:hypothetical protein
MGKEKKPINYFLSNQKLDKNDNLSNTTLKNEINSMRPNHFKSLNE